MLDEGLVLYVGLLVLLLWRLLSGWHCCGKWQEFTNYCVLLYALLLILMIYSGFVFVECALSDSGRSGWAELPRWMKPFLIAAPCASVVVYLICCVQTAQHVQKIRKNEAYLRHDRAVQIIALPAVYGTMSLSALARCYQLAASGRGVPAGTGEVPAIASVNATDMGNTVEARSDVCFMVGDLYEAWALYQFGQLTLDLIRSTIRRRAGEGSAQERERAEAILVAHTAVESLAWLGVTLFLLVCVGQAGWSLYLLTFTDASSDWSAYNGQMNCFKAAGVVASAAAIWNIHTVETTFHSYLQSYRPLLKFITVKIIVSFAFFQKGVVYALRAVEATLPSAIRNISSKVPLIGDILGFSGPQFVLFYAALLLYECVLIALLHWFAWSAEEEWYSEEEAEKEVEDPETRPLLPGSLT